MCSSNVRPAGFDVNARRAGIDVTHKVGTQHVLPPTPQKKTKYSEPKRVCATTVKPGHLWISTKSGIEAWIQCTANLGIPASPKHTHRHTRHPACPHRSTSYHLRSLSFTAWPWRLSPCQELWCTWAKRTNDIPEQFDVWITKSYISSVASWQ